MINTDLTTNSWRYKAVIISIAIASLGYLMFSFWAGWKEVTKAIAEVGILGVGVVLGLSLLNYAIRFIRWKNYLTLFSHTLPLWEHIRIYLAGFALTTTPGKAGEALRSFLLKPYGIPFKHSLAALLSERLSDLIAVILLAFIGLSQYEATRFLIAIGVIVIAIGLFLLTNEKCLSWALKKLLTRNSKVARVLTQLTYVLIEAQQCHKAKILIISTFLSLLAWGAEALAFYCILYWMGVDVPFSFAVFVYAISMLAGALSFMPGGLGGAEAVMIGLLMFKGVAGADAVAATILIRFATLWFAVVIGVSILVVKVYQTR